MPETTAFILACCGLYWMAVGAWTFFSTFRKVNPTASAIAPDSEPIPDRRLGRRRLGGLFWFTLGLGALWFAEIGGGATPPVQPEFEDVSSFDQSAIRQIDAWLQRQVDLSQFPSLSVAVVSNGAIVYQGAFGFEDLEAGVKATPETSYPVASVTKVFTTLLALMLHARGVVDLDKPVAIYLPEGVSISANPKLGATITLRQLASHTSGLPRGIPGRVQSVEGRYELEPRRLYDQLAGVTLEFDPGADEEYSNLGVGLLGHALERAAGKPYEQLLRETVCDPLGLERTAIQVNEKLHVATGYGSRVPRIPETHSYRERLAPSGGLITSAPDLATFLAAHMKPGLLSPEMLAWIFTPARLSDGSMASHSLGWSIDLSRPVGLVLHKNGGRNNCGAWIGFAPNHGVGVAVAANCGEPDVDQIGYWLLERAIPGGHRPATQYGYAKATPYSGVRWEDDRPIVCVHNRWSALVSIDGVTVEHILDFARNEFGDLAHKRFAEDLVEVLSKMGHDPDWEVTLGLESKEGQVEELKVRMTEENRNRVRN